MQERDLPGLCTERCFLRAWTAHGMHPLHQLLADAAVRRYLCDDTIFTLEQVSDLISRHLALVENRRAGMWRIEQQQDSPLIGFCGFLLIQGTPDLELMYGLLPKYWGRGLATEACRAALEYLWRETGFRRVYARTDPPNVKSIEVMRRLGMRFESSTETLVTYSLDRPLAG